MTGRNTLAFAYRSIMETIKDKNSRGEKVSEEYKKLKDLESEINKCEDSASIGQIIKYGSGKENITNRNEEINRLYNQGHSKQKLAEFFDISIPRVEQITTSKIEHMGKLRNKKLSNRELEILELTAEGLTDNDIAYRLNISPRTVQTHNKRINLKLMSVSKANAVYIGCKQEII